MKLRELEASFLKRTGDREMTREVTMDAQDEENRRKLSAMTELAYLRVNRALRERPDLTARTPSIAAPTLVSCGEWDMFYPCAVRDHRLIASSRLATIRRAAHATPDYQPQLWKQAVFDFIDDVESGRDVRGEVEYAPSDARIG